MHRLLIVDDEPIITNGLYQYFREVTDLDLEVYRAYSGKEALELVNRQRVDIVITDICMPVMDGIQLQGEIYSRWPQCKFIYLTSHGNIEYAQQAIRNGAFVDFVLKNEENEVLLEAVRKAIEDLEYTEINNEKWAEIQQKMKKAIPLVQKEYLSSLLEGKQETVNLRAEQFAKWEIPLKAELPVLMFVCKIDDYGEKFSPTDRNLLYFALENIVAEHLQHAVNFISIHYESHYIIWFVQPNDSNLFHDAFDPYWRGTMRFTYDSLERIQADAKRLLMASVSFAMTERPCDWNEVSLRYVKVKNMLNHYFGLSNERLILDNEIHDPDVQLNSLCESEEQMVRQWKNKVHLLDGYLETKNYERFMELLKEIFSIDAGVSYPYLMELRCSLQTIFISCLNRLGLFQTVAEHFDLEEIFHLSGRYTWKDLGNIFVQLAEFIIDADQNENQNRVRHLVDSVNEYIEQHLQEDLSLIRIAELVYLSPTYFSKLYKNMTGMNFKEYVTDRRMKKAAELLQTTNLKIKDIAEAVGFESPPYFNRAFKKYYKVTPLEYREMNSSLELQSVTVK